MMKIKICGINAEVSSFEEASKLVRKIIELCNMGSTEWYEYEDNGTITEGKNKVALVSYNGVVWLDKGGVMVL